MMTANKRTECRAFLEFLDTLESPDLNYLLDAVFDRLMEKDTPSYNYVINSMTRAATRVGERLRDVEARR